MIVLKTCIICVHPNSCVIAAFGEPGPECQPGVLMFNWVWSTRPLELSVVNVSLDGPGSQPVRCRHAAPPTGSHSQVQCEVVNVTVIGMLRPLIFMGCVSESSFASKTHGLVYTYVFLRKHKVSTCTNASHLNLNMFVTKYLRLMARRIISCT